jgi:hypothetical protein
MHLSKSSVADAMYVFCPACDTLMDTLNLPWGPRQAKGMHERGTGHRPFYVTAEFCTDACDNPVEVA